MVHMIVRITLVDGGASEYIEEYKRIVEEVKKEAGCIDYCLYLDHCDARFDNEKRENMVVFSEKWDSVDAIVRHSKSDLMKKFRERIAHLRVSSSYELLSPVQ